MRTLSALVLCSLFFPLSALTQDLFERTYGSLDMDQGNSVHQTADGGYIFGGYTNSFGAGQDDCYLIRTDQSGDTLWTRTYGGSEIDWGNDVRQTADGGFIATGFTYSYGAGAGDVILIKTDRFGDMIWTRTFGGDDFDSGHSIRQTSDEGYIIVGSTHSFGSPSDDAYMIKTDSVGVTIWARGYGSDDDDYGRAVRETSDGGYVFVGNTNSFGAGSSDIYLVKTDSLGNPQWFKTYGNTGTDRGNDVQQTQDGGYIIAGDIFLSGSGGRDAYLVKTNSDGDTLWTRTFGGNASDIGSSVSLTNDDGYILTGYTESFGAGSRDVFLIKTNSFGMQLWSRTYGGTEWDWGKSVQQTLDGGYVIGGYTDSFGNGNRDFYMIKTNSAGYLGIETGGTDESGIPVAYSLSQNFPNPFNPMTTITFEIPGNADGRELLSLTIYDIRGKLVRELINSTLKPGKHLVVWDGLDDGGRKVQSGLYLYRLKTGESFLTRKMTVLK
jgi:hypothetical protein